MIIKKSDFIRICPMAEMNPGEWGVVLDGGFLVTSPPHGIFYGREGNRTNAVAIGADCSWSGGSCTKQVGILSPPESITVEED